MWVFTTVGYFSVTRDTSHPDRLQVRARVKGDLDLLRSSYLPELTPTIQLPGRDYPYRGYCTKEQWGGALVQISMALDYGNFKSEVTKKQGLAREQLYAQVWSVMFNAEDKIRKNAQENARWNAKEKAGWFKQEGKASNGNGDGKGYRSWYNHQTSFKYSTPDKRATEPVTRIGGPDTTHLLNASDYEDPFDNVEDAAVSEMSDEEFQEYLMRNERAFLPDEPKFREEATDQEVMSDLDFLDQVAREAMEMEAARNAKNGGVTVRKGKNKKGKR